MRILKHGAVALAFCILGATSVRGATAERNLIVGPLGLSFGKVQVGTISVPQIIKLSNRCGSVLGIQPIGQPRGPFAIHANSCGTRLEQCGDCGVSVTFNPITASDPRGTVEAGELAILSDAANSPERVKLTGIAFGRASSRAPTPMPLRVTKSAMPSAMMVINGGNYLTAYSLGGYGDVAPIASIDGAATGLAAPFGIAMDPAGNIYVLNSEARPSPSGSITVYRAGTNGNVDPVATIQGPNTGLKSVKAVAVDSTGNIYAANMESGFESGADITIYRAGSNGNVNPTATIVGDDTHLLNPAGVAVDSSGNIYVAELGGGGPSHKDSGEVLVFPPGSNGDVSPSAIITGSNTGITQPVGIALDSSGKIYVTSNDERGTGGGVGTIAVFAARSDGDVRPLATIVGPEPRHVPHYIPIFRLGAIALDASGNIYVAGVSSDPGSAESILVYPPHSDGNVRPIGILSGDNTGLFLPQGIAIGPYSGGPRTN